jgi:hypothetical protein
MNPFDLNYRTTTLTYQGNCSPKTDFCCPPQSFVLTGTILLVDLEEGRRP